MPWKKIRHLMCMIILALLFSPLGHGLLVSEALMWSVSNTEPLKLVVCWENPSTANPLSGESATASGATRREWARQALKKSWERYARVIFVGWGTCQNETNALSPPHTVGPRRPGTEDENLKVNITSSGASSNPGHGSWGDYQKAGINLNLHCDPNNNTDLKTCIEYLAAHEFGHALGFYHSEERADWPSTTQCPEQWSSLMPDDPWWPIPSEKRFGAPDTASLMAYCSDPSKISINDLLSPRDIAAVQRTYGRHLPGTLLSTVGSLCLSAHAAQPNGDRAFSWECDEALDDQEWLYDPLRSSLSIWQTIPLPAAPWKIPIRQRCLDVNTVNFFDVQTWDCHFGPNQQWQFWNVMLRGYGGLCITRASSGFGVVTAQTCTGTDSQKWRLVPTGNRLAPSVQIRAETASVCLKAQGGDGTPIVTDHCGGSFDQYFALASGGELRPLSTNGKCLDVRDVWDADYVNGSGGPTSGQVVQIFGCHAQQLNQKWSVSGNVVSGAQCLGRRQNGVRNGTLTMVTACNNSIDQQWDYSW